MTDDRTNSIPLVFTTLVLGMLVVALGQMIFATALPTIVGDLGGVDQMTWVITAYLLTMTIGLPIYGNLGDQLGRKPLYVFALCVFLAGSVVGALAGNMALLITARAIQGVGGGGLMILSQAIIADVVPARDRGRYMGIMGSVFGLSSVLGPVLGGFFTDGPGWRWALWFNVPICVLALLATIFVLRIPRRGSGFSLDVPGTALMAVSTACLVLGTTWAGSRYEWTSPVILTLFALTAVGAVAFVRTARRARKPLIPMSLFAERNFVLTTSAGLIIGVAMFGVFTYMPTYIQMVHGLSPTLAGLMTTPMMFSMIATSTIVGFVVSHTGRYKWYPVGGTVIMAAGLGLIGTLDQHDGLVRLGVALFVFGFGLGSCMQLLVLIVQNTFPIEIVGTATASNNFFRQIGGTLGSAIVGSVFTARLVDIMDPRVDDALASMDSGGSAFASTFEHDEGHAASLTPEILSELPGRLADAVMSSYNDALAPVFLVLVPVILAGTVLLAFIREDELKKTVE